MCIRDRNVSMCMLSKQTDTRFPYKYITDYTSKRLSYVEFDKNFLERDKRYRFMQNAYRDLHERFEKQRSLYGC